MNKKLMIEIEKINTSLQEVLLQDYYKFIHLFISFEYNSKNDDLYKIICKCGKNKCVQAIIFYQKYGLEFN